jgi:hypothetical protein
VELNPGILSGGVMEWWSALFPKATPSEAPAWPEQSFFGLDLCGDFKLSQEHFPIMKALSTPTGLRKTLFAWTTLMGAKQLSLARIPTRPGRTSCAGDYATAAAICRQCLSSRGEL